MVHQLFSRAVVLVKEVSNLVLKEGVMPGNTVRMADLKIDGSVLKKAEDCNFGGGLEDDLNSLDTIVKDGLLDEMKKSVVEAIKYLQSHLPLKDKFLANMRFISPQYRERSEMPGAIVFLAQELGRFSKEELANLNVQINLYQVRQ